MSQNEAFHDQYCEHTNVHVWHEKCACVKSELQLQTANRITKHRFVFQTVRPIARGQSQDGNLVDDDVGPITTCSSEWQ